MSSHSRTRWAAALSCVAFVLACSACGDDSADSGGSASGTSTAAGGEVFNAADVAFASEMIPHHAQAIEMVTLTDGRALDPAVAELAGRIREAQVPEVETMTDWLTAWGEPVPETSLDHTNAGHDLGEMSEMPGMMSAEEMTELGAASDADFQDLWLTMMAEHHDGAIEMAQTEQADGENADAVALAETIESAQQAEVDEIETLLGE